MTDPHSDVTGAGSSSSSSPDLEAKQRRHFRSSLKVIAVLLPLWFVVSYGCGILFRDWLDQNAPEIGHAPFGFWMAQQGSIVGFVVILIVYAVWMSRLDRKYEYTEKL